MTPHNFLPGNANFLNPPPPRAEEPSFTPFTSVNSSHLLTNPDPTTPVVLLPTQPYYTCSSSNPLRCRRLPLRLGWRTRRVFVPQNLTAIPRDC